MEKKQNKKSVKALQVSIIGLLSAVFAVSLLASFLLSRLLSWAPNAERSLSIIIWLVLLGIWAVQSLILLNSWKSMEYEADGQSIRLTMPNGMFKSSKTVYRYESILSIRMTQGLFGKKYRYGNIYFAIPKLEKEVALKGIENPSVQLELIQSKLHKKGADTQVLIS